MDDKGVAHLRPRLLKCVETGAQGQTHCGDPKKGKLETTHDPDAHVQVYHPFKFYFNYLVRIRTRIG